MSKDSNKLATEALDEIDEQVARIENEELTRWQRQRRRWLSGRTLLANQIGSTLMLIKLTVGKKLAVAAAIKWPTLATAWSATWKFLVGLAAGAKAFLAG